MARVRLSLTSDRVIAWLLEHGQLEEPGLVSGNIRVEEVPGRNVNFRVKFDHGSGWFIKQAPADEPVAPYLAVEATLYQMAAAGGHFPSATMPGLVLWHPDDAILVTELVTSPADFTTPEDPEADPVPRGFGPAFGSALAAIHRIRPGSLGAEALVLPTDPPWVLGIGRPHPGQLRCLSAGQLELLRAIQGGDGVQKRLDALAAAWLPNALVHGDVKWPNLLLAGGSANQPDLRFVDWELAQWGDPLWDLGGALQTYLSDVIHWCSTESGRDPAAAATTFGDALPALRREIGLLWAAYWGGVSPGSTAVRRVVEYSAARLLQSAFEWSQTEARMPRRAVAACQLAFNLLANAEAGAAAVFGLPNGEAS